MQRVWMHIGWIVMVMLLLLGCSDDHQEIPTTKSGQKLYHEIDDPFEFYGAESGLPFEVMVEEIWMEDFAEHEDYISEHVHHPDESRRSEEHTSELQSRGHLVCRLLVEK